MWRCGFYVGGGVLVDDLGIAVSVFQVLEMLEQ